MEISLTRSGNMYFHATQANRITSIIVITISIYKKAGDIFYFMEVECGIQFEKAMRAAPPPCMPSRLLPKTNISLFFNVVI